MHVDTEQAQRFLHGELAPPTGAAVRAHVATCAECRARIVESERAEAEVSDLLRLLDHETPRVAAREVVTRARSPRFPWTRWAAGILLAVGAAGAAYAAPGSPLPRWLEAITTRVGREAAPPAPAPALPRDASSVLAGIAVAPGEHLVIAFPSAAPAATATVQLTTDTEVAVRAVAGAATFTSEIDRLFVEPTGSSAAFEIRIPANAPHVEVRSGSRRIFLLERGRVTTHAPRDPAGGYLLSLAGS